MSNLSAYAAALRVNDALIEVHKKIDHNMSLQAVQAKALGPSCPSAA
jgi:hypothetical protein